MAVETETSIDRFLLYRAPAYIGLLGAKMAVALNGVLGTAFSLLGLGLVAGSYFGQDPGMLIGAAGCLFGGGVNLGVAGYMLRKNQQMQPFDVKLTEEAAQFIHQLMKSAFGWRYRWVGWEGFGATAPGYQYRGFGPRFRHRGESGEATNQKPAKAFLRSDVYELLDGVMKQYNRIYGLLTCADLSPNSTVGKKRTSILHAIDETMAEVLHQAALLNKYPESNLPAAQIIKDRTAMLCDTADRMESLVQRTPEALPAEKTATALESVLEELKMQDVAQAELESTEEEKVDLRQS